jgi:hypothetical protein
MTTQSGSGAPPAWDLDWEPSGRSGAPDRWPPTADASYAEFPLRATAFAIDVVVVAMIFQLLGQARAIIMFWLQRFVPQETAEAALVIAGLALVLGSLALSATVIYFWRVFRATPGQMLFGLFVIRRGSGTMLSRGAATVRWLLLYAPLALILSYSALIDVISTVDRAIDPVIIAAGALLVPLAWYLILALSTLVEGKRGRGLHDRIAGSVVVRRAGPPA